MSDDAITRTRMQTALTIVQGYAKEAAAAEREAYVSYVRAAPAMLRRSGLGQTLAVLKARGRESGSGGTPRAYRRLYGQLQDWLCAAPRDLAPFETDRDLIEQIAAADQETYLRAQSEAELYLGWLKKFADAFLTEPPADAGSAVEAPR